MPGPGPHPMPPAPDWHYSENYTPGHSPDINTPLVDLTKHIPSKIAVGQVFESVLDVNAKKPVKDVIVTDTVPVGTTVVKTEPTAQQQGNKLVWKINTMNRG